MFNPCIRPTPVFTAISVKAVAFCAAEPSGNGSILAKYSCVGPVPNALKDLYQSVLPDLPFLGYL